mmetsp:Transcript_17620/g.27201  ORF Transcript_17620/g.27201 Transcript_17620/m.27201 type:complete len:173 (+) Transcript_17620:115-633(+)
MMPKITFWFIVLWITIVSTAAFVAIPQRTRHHLTSTTPMHDKIRWNAVICQSQNNPDDKSNTEDVVLDTIEQNDNKNANEFKPPSPSSLGPTKKIVRNVTFAISSIWNFVIMFLGVGFSLGLGLNLLGYAYIIGDTGVEIDTISNMRAKQQFRSAEIQLMKGSGTNKNDNAD